MGIEGRRTRTPEATFHSLRHTFVSLAANACVPLLVVQSIVGHSSSAMTLHYYNEDEDVLQQAVATTSAIGTGAPAVPHVALPTCGTPVALLLVAPRQGSVLERLKRLVKYLAQGLITQDEHAVQRARILAEL